MYVTYKKQWFYVQYVPTKVYPSLFIMRTNMLRQLSSHSRIELVNEKDPQKSVNLKFNTVGRRDDDMIVPPSDGPMIISIDWE